MGKNSKKNTGIDQKAQWVEVNKLSRASSKFIKVTPANEYVPEKKEPSKRDLHRMTSGYKKFNS